MSAVYRIILRSESSSSKRESVCRICGGFVVDKIVKEKEKIDRKSEKRESIYLYNNMRPCVLCNYPIIMETRK